MATNSPSVLRNDQAVIDACASSTSIGEALRYLGLRAAGGNYKSFHQALDRLGINPPDGWKADPTKAARERLTRPDNDVFVIDSTYSNRRELKKRLARNGMAQMCASCGIGPEWNGSPLTLQLEHANGVFNDNRVENLSLLCPNCHSQTETFAGGNAGGRTGNRTPVE